MKKIFLSLALISMIVISSCSNDPVTPPPADTPKFTLLDSIPNGNIRSISMADENNVYLAGQISSTVRGIKISDGVKTEIDFAQASFIPDRVHAHSSSYYVYAGHTSDRTFLKIFNSGALTTVLLDSAAPRVISAVKIYQPGKIAVAADSSIYIYNNGGLAKYKTPGGFSIYEIAYSESKIDFAASANFASTERVYRLENDSLKLLFNMSVSSFKYQLMQDIGGYLVNQTASTSGTTYSYLNGITWTPLFTRTPNFPFLRGESLNNIYLIGEEVIWNGSTFQNDPAPLPVREGELLTLQVSNLRSDAYFISVRYESESTTYIYRRK